MPSTGNSLGGVGDGEDEEDGGGRDGSLDRQRQAMKMRDARTSDEDNELCRRYRNWHITLL
jgi:hypothetical protein